MSVAPAAVRSPRSRSQSREASSPPRPRRPPIAKPIWQRDERRRLDVVDLPTPHRECLHRHQVLQHAETRVAAARTVVDEQRKRADRLLLLIEDEHTSRANALHEVEDLRVDLLRAREHAELELRLPLFGL